MSSQKLPLLKCWKQLIYKNYLVIQSKKHLRVKCFVSKVERQSLHLPYHPHQHLRQFHASSTLASISWCIVSLDLSKFLYFALAASILPYLSLILIFFLNLVCFQPLLLLLLLNYHKKSPALVSYMCIQTPA